MATFELEYSETIQRGDNYGRLIRQDYYTNCKRCDISIPKGVREYCSI